MLGEIVVLALIASLVVVPLMWRNAMDRRQEEGLRLQASLQSKANRRLGGESLLVVAVHPPLAGQRGRVVLSAPESWTWLIGQVWSEILEATPEGYDLVVPGHPGRSVTVETPRGAPAIAKTPSIARAR